MPTGHGRGHGRGHGGGCAVSHAALILKEEVPPAIEQHVEDPILEEIVVA